MALETDILPPRYRGPKRIARGGMGEIYRATDDILGRAVAVKLLSNRYSVDDAVGSRFTREALAAARLSGQSNTVTIFDVGEWNDRPFIVMEYLPGGSLADRLNAEGAQPAGTVIHWLEQTAAALDTAHGNGIVHRDVKPANLLLDREGNVHVADFGIASAAGMDSLTTTGMVLGTAGYLSPEQAQGAATTPASDRYALAVTAYELLTGRRPFQRESVTAEAAAHVHAPVPSVCDRLAALPCELDPVFRRGLSKHPAARYPTCAEFVGDLRHALSEAAGATAALLPVPSSLPVKETRRGRWIAIGLALAAAATAGIVVAVLLGRGQGSGTQTVVRSVTLPGTTVRATVTQSTTVQQTVTSTPPPTTTAAAPPPSSADGHDLNDRGYALMQQGDYAAALPLFREAVEKLRGSGPGDPYEAYANYNLGYTLLQLRSCDEALVYLRVANALEDAKEVDKAIRRAEQCTR